MKMCIMLWLGFVCLAVVVPAVASESMNKVPSSVQRQMEETRAQIVKWLTKVDSDAFRPG
jgi:hypothetical protein